MLQNGFRIVILSSNNSKFVKSIWNSSVDWTNLYSFFVEFIIEVLEIYLTNNNSTFDGHILMQQNRAAVEAATSCSYWILVTQPTDNDVIDAKRAIFQKQFLIWIVLTLLLFSF